MHGPIFDTLQHFPLPPDTDTMLEHDSPYVDPITNQINWYYRPFIPIRQLKGSRRNLILDPRGWFKTTINTECHSVQWIVNYPNIGLATVQSSTEKARGNLELIKHHFRFNRLFRQVFPEHCPPIDIKEFGTTTDFISLARSLTVNRQESTVQALSLESRISGPHFEVIKFADIVEEENSQFETGRNSVYNFFGAFIYTLKAPVTEYWLDVEGTRYHENDTYGRIIESDLKLPLQKREWTIHVRGCYKKKSLDPSNLTLKHSIDELDYDDDLTPEGKRISNFPQLETTEQLEQQERTPPMTPAKFACQKKCNPTDYDSTDKIFPLQYLKILTLSDYSNLFKTKLLVSNEVSIDTAETQNESSCFNVITVGQWTSTNHLIVREIRRGKLNPIQLHENIVTIEKIYHPSCYFLEETGYNLGLVTFFSERHRTNPREYPNITIKIHWLKRKKTESKESRIQACLQSFYLAGSIHILESIPCIDALKQELNKFPKGTKKDILDTLADLFSNKQFYRNAPLITQEEKDNKAYTEYFYRDRSSDMGGDFKITTGLIDY